VQHTRFLLVGGIVLVAACAESPTSVIAPPVDGAARAVGAAIVVHVTSNADAGPGSLRQALLDAGGDPAIGVVHVTKGLGTIAIAQPLVFTGAQALTLRGSDATIDGLALGAGESALVATGGASLDIRELTVQNAPGSGILVDVPAGASGTISFSLSGSHIRDNGKHGVIVNDQTEYFKDPNSTLPDGSDASLLVLVQGSEFDGNGNGEIDQDGLRVNEGGIGSITATIRGSIFRRSGADGLELDERGDGDAIFTVERTQLVSNGAFSTVDPDDGIDVDESGNGHIVARFTDVVASDNSEQGVDLNENDAGDLEVFMTRVEASRNAEEGIEFEEDDDVAGGGDLRARLLWTTTIGNGAGGGDAGLKLREKDVGNLSAEIINAVSSTNVGLQGILVREDADGSMDATITSATTTGNGSDGIKLDENGNGNLSVRVIGSTSSNNAGAGIDAEQQASGAGTLRVRSLIGGGNADGDIKTDPGVVLITL
jgi:hypothetical protein